MRFMIDRRLVAHFDFLLLLTVLAITGLGTMTVYSATFNPALPAVHPLAVRQAAWAGAGVIAVLIMVSFDYKALERYAYVAYVAGLCLLIAVPLFGSVGGGSRRWISIGPVSIQPSEMMKLAMIVALARYLHRKSRTDGLLLQDLLVPVALLLPPVVLILQQPDLGTAGVFCFVFASMMWIAGLHSRTYLILGGVALAMVPMAPVLMSHLKPYQLKRISTFLNPELDALGAGYHVIQSKIAIGSGQTWGKGFMNGTQNQLRFLPEQHTDFIFSVFSEEWGFGGACVLLALYLVLTLRGLVVVYRAKDRFGAVLVFGILSNVFWQVAINIGMTSGLLPVVGITLPFFSYGGSSLVTLMAALGLVVNVNMRRIGYDRIAS